MRKSLLSFLVFLGALLLTGCNSKTLKQYSPDKNICVILSDSTMTVKYKNRTVQTVKLELGQCSGWSRSIGSVQENYKMLSGKRKGCICEFSDLLYEGIDDRKLLIRVYNDGVAFRYQGGEESISYLIPDGTKRWLQRQKTDYEGFYQESTSATNGKYSYHWAWWLQRQITLQEFRIGSLEFEFVKESDQRRIEIHIPSDANMKLEVLCQSIAGFVKFQRTYFPEWNGVQMVTETWMIMPELEDFLPADSKILRFKALFDVDAVDYGQTWYMGWIFPGHEEISESLPEKTTLHRRLKEHLLSGKKFGIARGRLVMDRVKRVLDERLVTVVPDPRQVAFQETEFYAFVHFTVNTFI